jgi:hypothetical protein
MEEFIYNKYEFTTLITTNDYACGVVCLAQSLLLVNSIGKLVCWVTNEDVSNAIYNESLKSPGYLPKVLIYSYHSILIISYLSFNYYRIY